MAVRRDRPLRHLRYSVCGKNSVPDPDVRCLDGLDADSELRPRRSLLENPLGVHPQSLCACYRSPSDRLSPHEIWMPCPLHSNRALSPPLPGDLPFSACAIQIAAVPPSTRTSASMPRTRCAALRGEGYEHSGGRSEPKNMFLSRRSPQNGRCLFWLVMYSRAESNYYYLDGETCAENPGSSG